MFDLPENSAIRPVSLDDLLYKTAAGTLALTIGTAAIVDGSDGVKRYDFDGHVKVVEALASTVSSGPTPPTYVQDMILGFEHEVVRPDPQKIDFGVSVVDPSSGASVPWGSTEAST